MRGHRTPFRPEEVVDNADGTMELDSVHRAIFCFFNGQKHTTQTKVQDGISQLRIVEQLVDAGAIANKGASVCLHDLQHAHIDTLTSLVATGVVVQTQDGSDQAVFDVDPHKLRWGVEVSVSEPQFELERDRGLADFASMTKLELAMSLLSKGSFPVFYE